MLFEKKCCDKKNCNRDAVIILHEKYFCAQCAFDKQVEDDKSDRRVRRYNDDLYTSGGYRPSNNY